MKMDVRSNLKLRRLLKKADKDLMTVCGMLDDHHTYPNSEKIDADTFTDKDLDKLDDKLTDMIFDVGVSQGCFRNPYSDPHIYLPNIKPLNKIGHQRVTGFKYDPKKDQLILSLKKYPPYKKILRKRQKEYLRKALKDHKDKFDWLINRINGMKDKVNSTDKKNHLKALLYCGRYSQVLFNYGDHYSPSVFAYPIRGVLEKYHICRVQDLIVFAYEKSQHPEKVNTQNLFVHLKELSVEAYDQKRLHSLIKHLVQAPRRFAIIPYTTDDGKITHVHLISVKEFNEMANKSIRGIKNLRHKC